MLKLALTALSPPGPRALLSILIFHRVLSVADPLFPDEMDARRFDDVCRWVRQWFNVLPLADAIGRLRNGSLPGRALSITFDDGYADNVEVALPILQRYGLTATCFVASDFIDGGCMWNDRVIQAVRQCRDATLKLPGIEIEGRDRIEVHDLTNRRLAIDRLLAAFKYLQPEHRLRLADALLIAAKASLPRTLMVSSRQLASMASGGMDVGGHTASHPILAGLSLDAARLEIVRSKRVLESVIQMPVDLFAYPNGKPGVDYTARDAGLVTAAGFKAAVSTAWGAADSRADAFQLPRFTPWDRTRLRFGLRLALNALARGDRCERGLQELQPSPD